MYENIQLKFQMRPTVTILYHFFHPDDVVSARHFSQLAEGLVQRGWDVTVLASNRYCRYPKRKIEEKKEVWNGVKIIRLWRPGWNQANRFLRLANSAWMLAAWTLKLLTMPRTDAIIIGTDPPFSALLFPVIRKLKRGKVLAHWCFDLYPDAIEADSKGLFIKWISGVAAYLMKRAYRSVDLMVDLGGCMRKRLSGYGHNAVSATVTPWAIVEPEEIPMPDLEARSALFGDAKLALLYSGNLGRAHDYMLFLKLARRLRENSDIAFCFACRGNRAEELRKAVGPDDINVNVAPFAGEHELEIRLASADMHLLSLRPQWEGIVVPSKFFGSMAVGRPVLFAGPEGSSIAGWLKKYDAGFVLTEKNMEEVASRLFEIADSPDMLLKMRQNAFEAYRFFSMRSGMDAWVGLLEKAP